MGKTVFLILGNGFTIDFLKKIQKNNEIDVSNLFRYGAHVPWPSTGEPGFLSFKHCPNLWNLGARPTMSSEESISLIEDIITCTNAYAITPHQLKKTEHSKSNDIYIYAYKELVKYLKHLFIYYDSKVPEIPSEISDWDWIKFLKRLQNDEKISYIRIVTYNYDLWLERILNHFNIDFNMRLFDNQPHSKISIIKSHGSISFKHQNKLDSSAFEIRKNFEIEDNVLQNFQIDYEEMNAHSLADAIIPPAGEAGRYEETWAGQLRTESRAWAKQMKSDDYLIISGLSYWHVDRSEIDRLLTECNRDISVRMINPSPPRTMNAVLASLFDNYVLHTSTDVLAEIMK